MGVKSDFEKAFQRYDVNDWIPSEEIVWAFLEGLRVAAKIAGKPIGRKGFQVPKMSVQIVEEILSAIKEFDA